MAARLQLISSHLISGSNSGIVELIVESILSTGLHNATAAAIYLQSYTSNLSASTAELVLKTLAAKVHTAKEGASPKFREAYNKAVEGAQMIEEFVKDHPVYSTIIVLSILAIMCPPIVHVLGFTLNGVTKGSFAAAWQSTYGAAVPAGSLFAYFQHLGATMMV